MQLFVVFVFFLPCRFALVTVTPKTRPAVFAVNEVVLGGVKGGIDLLYRDKDVQRFYVLETVARVPYFAFASVLHLKETLGDRRGCDLLQLHYAQSDNELHHLLVMEALGGNESPVDRAVAQGAAMAFFWYATALYALAPKMAYHLSELIETHAYATYDAYLKKHEKDLKRRPVPAVARHYYEQQNPFLFDLSVQRRRRPTKLRSLYDVFLNVRDDEQAHCTTLANLRKNGAGAPPRSSLSLKKKPLFSSSSL
mmetsp:Transcript_6269/g.20434  ORF Transcript_6269/g.20434 Transcript_6269/m.20434 type:complete len:253 (+) Transcript_6269:127-885(+)|eukprot:CAMPEP_0118898316 /NCGR_PEP_ID=MMETSP1166-20130328/5351_1 /TAXON_ID=1104430 /ORGANISM="Chrysoreinhardia sp, Strain CCMP3193" /LENGTH=252 /DNA_ID=CAMNT_0006837415 /DNA_START=1 /DNA_END=759 /DNA_ORIENTATION=+